MSEEKQLEFEDIRFGMSVRYSKPEGGYPGDMALGKKYLELGGVYTVHGFYVHSSSTDLYLAGLPVKFNHCLFTVVEVEQVNQHLLDEQSRIEALRVSHAELKAALEYCKYAFCMHGKESCCTAFGEAHYEALELLETILANADKLEMESNGK